MLKKLWNDEAGYVSAEIILILTILVIGVVTGLSSVRDAVITELADVGAAIGSVDQSYTVGGSVSHSAATASFGFTDANDFCDNQTPGGSNARCVVIDPTQGVSNADSNDFGGGP